MATKHFLSLQDLQRDEILSVLDRALTLKRLWLEERRAPQVMRNQSIALVFEKSSTRTRVSFEAASYQLGGNAIFLAPGDSQIKRGESPADTARILSGIVDAIITRTDCHSTVETYAEYSTVPVINGLSDIYHPCQLLADLLTLLEVRKSIADAVVAWVGDGNNMCVTWAQAAVLLGFDFRICTPPGYAPSKELMADYVQSNRIELISDPETAACNADVVVTDTWLSMSQTDEDKQRPVDFKPYQVTENIMSKAAPHAVFMHCLPAYRGKEVEGKVLDGPQSVVWQEAENRLHAQKALLEFLLT